MSMPKQPNQYRNYYAVKNPTFNGSGASNTNNHTFCTNNGAYPDRPYSRDGYTYSIGKRY